MYKPTMARVTAEVTPQRCLPTPPETSDFDVGGCQKTEEGVMEWSSSKWHSHLTFRVSGWSSQQDSIDMHSLKGWLNQCDAKLKKFTKWWEVLSLLPLSPGWQMLQLFSVPICVQDRRHVLKTKYFAIFEHKQSQVSMFSTLWFFFYKFHFLSIFFLEVPLILVCGCFMLCYSAAWFNKYTLCSENTTPQTMLQVSSADVGQFTLTWVSSQFGELMWSGCLVRRRPTRSVMGTSPLYRYQQSSLYGCHPSWVWAASRAMWWWKRNHAITGICIFPKKGWVAFPEHDSLFSALWTACAHPLLAWYRGYSLFKWLVNCFMTQKHTPGQRHALQFL